MLIVLFVPANPMAILAPPPPQIQRSSQLPLHTVSAMFGTPLPIPCTNCHDKQLTCEAHPHTKGSCYHCIVRGLPCLFPPNTILWHGSPDAFRFQRNCIHCTRSHQKCIFDTDSPLQCKRCMKLKIPCSFQLSSQGSRNDLKWFSINWSSAMPEMMLETLQIAIPPMTVGALFFHRGTHGVSCSVI